MPHNPPRNTRDGAAELWVKLWSFALFPRRSLVFSAKQIPLGEIFTLRAAAGNSEKWFDCASTPTKRASGKLQNHRRKPALETAINILAQFPTLRLRGSQRKFHFSEMRVYQAVESLLLKISPLAKKWIVHC